MNGHYKKLRVGDFGIKNQRWTGNPKHIFFGPDSPWVLRGDKNTSESGAPLSKKVGAGNGCESLAEMF